MCAPRRGAAFRAARLCSLEAPCVVDVALQDTSHARRHAAWERAPRDGRGGRANGGTRVGTVAGPTRFSRAHRARVEGVPKHARPVALRRAERALRERRPARSVRRPVRVREARVAATGAEARHLLVCLLVGPSQDRQRRPRTSSTDARHRSSPPEKVARVVRVARVARVAAPRRGARARSVAAAVKRAEFPRVRLRHERSRVSRSLGTVGVVPGVVPVPVVVLVVVVARDVVVATRQSLSAARVQRGALDAHCRGGVPRRDDHERRRELVP